MRTATLILLLTALAAVLPARAQRNVTPVESDDKKPPQPTLHYYDKHGNPLDEPVLFLATLDTIKQEKSPTGPAHPCLHAVDFGLNFMDGIFAIAGQHYGGADLWASLSMWNRLYPTLELGLGAAKDTPDGLNYTYKGTPAFYARLGADYNFLHKGNPDYKLLLGLRAGFSSFSYTLTGITVNNPYWGQAAHFSMPDQSTTALWGEVLAGIRVKLVKAWSLGWTLRYRFMASCPDAANSRPWYVPGFGTRDGWFGMTMSVIYTLPLGKKEPAADPEGSSATIK